MPMAKPTRKYNREVYHHYMMGSKRELRAEADRLRRTGVWKARIAKVKDGYILFTRQK